MEPRTTFRLYTNSTDRTSIATLVVTKDNKFFQVKPAKMFYDSVDTWKAAYPTSATMTSTPPRKSYYERPRKQPANPDYAFLKKYTPPNLLLRGTYGSLASRANDNLNFYMNGYAPRHLWALKYKMGGYTQKTGFTIFSGKTAISTIKEFAEAWNKSRPFNPSLLSDFLKFNGLTESMPYSALKTAMDEVCKRSITEEPQYKALVAKAAKSKAAAEKHGQQTAYYTPGNNSFVYVKSKQNLYPLFYNEHQVYFEGEFAPSLAALSIDKRNLYVMNRRSLAITPLYPEEEPGPLVLGQPWMLKTDDWVQTQPTQPTQASPPA